MTATAATSAARYLSDDALASDLQALHTQLAYAGAFDEIDGLQVIRRERAPERLLRAWDALCAERDTRHSL